MMASPLPTPGIRVRNSAAARRGAARLQAVQALYQMEIAGGDAEDVVQQFDLHPMDAAAADDDGTAVETDRRLFADIVTGVCRRREDLTRLLADALSPDWPPARLEVILRCILLSGAYELVARRSVPARVIITEHVNLAHAFFHGAEPGMVNGVLDRLTRSVRPGELEGDDGGRDTPAG